MILVSLYATTIPYATMRKDRVESRIMVEVLVNMVRHQRCLVRKRKFISKIRRTGNLDLVRRRLIVLKFVGLTLFMGKVYRQLLSMDYEKCL